MVTRLVLADDKKEFRQYLRALLDKDPGLTVIGEAEDGQAAIRGARERANMMRRTVLPVH
jgi:DNA-binding NarL/FixJ family response regulator